MNRNAAGASLLVSARIGFTCAGVAAIVSIEAVAKLS